MGSTEQFAVRARGWCRYPGDAVWQPYSESGRRWLRSVGWTRKSCLAPERPPWRRGTPRLGRLDPGQSGADVGRCRGIDPVAVGERQVAVAQPGLDGDDHRRVRLRGRQGLIVKRAVDIEIGCQLLELLQV